MNYASLFGEECFIWSGHTAKAYNELDGRGYFVEHSPRAGGSYSLSREAKYMLDELDAHAKEKTTTKITTWLVDQRRLGNAIPRVTTTIIEEAKAARDLTADERAERLLGFLAQQTTNLGSAVWVAITKPVDRRYIFHNSVRYRVRYRLLYRLPCDGDIRVRCAPTN